MNNLLLTVIQALRRRKGQSMVEYVFIIGLVALMLIAVVGLIHEPLEEIFQSVLDAL